MSFALYPDPPVRALSVPAGETVFTSFAARSARVAELDPPYAQVMFIRVAMLGGTSAPGLLVAAGAGAPVEVSVDPQGVFRSPGEVGYVGDVWLEPLGPNVFEILVGLVSVEAGLGWRLGIRNTDAVDRHFTLVVADSEADTVQPWVDPGPPDYEVTATIPIGGTPSHITLDPAHQTAYVANHADNSVAVIDLAGRAVVATIPVGQPPDKVAVDPDAHTVYVSSGDPTISVIDTTTRAVTTTIAAAPQPGALAVDPDRRMLYVGCGSFEAGAILMIDTDTRTVTGTVPVGHRPFDLAIDPTSHTVYATDFIANAVLALDPDSRAVTPINVNKRPFGVAVDPVSRAVYVSCLRDNTVIMFDPRTQAMTTIPVGSRPEGVAVDAGTYTVYVANRGEDTVSAIDTRTGALTAVRVGRPQGVAVDPVTHTAVSPADTAAAYVAVIERRR